MALPVVRGTISEYGYKGRGRVTLSTGKNLALRGSAHDKEERVPQPGDAVWCHILYSQEEGMLVASWVFE